MKILLVVPNIKSNDIMPCLSLAYLKSYINEKSKHKAKIIDLLFNKKNWKEVLLTRIHKEKPNIIGFSVLSFNYPEALEIARYIKDNFNIKIIFGGVHVILSPEEVIKNNEVDFVCTGEGEEVLKELLDKNLNGNNVRGIWYKYEGEIIKNPKKNLIKDLDNLPFPDFEDFNLNHYFVLNHNHFPILASRGCPYSCTYCSNHALRKNLEGKYVRFRSVNNIIKEIKVRIKQYHKHGFTYLYFFDDTFIINKDFIINFCNNYKNNGFHKSIKWTANVRANLVTDEIIQTMKDAGCYEVRMGVESGNDYILNKVYNRNMTRKELIRAFKIIKNHSLYLRLDFIYGAPFETINMMDESLELAKQSKGDDIFFSLLYPLPGTEIRELCKEEHIINNGRDYSLRGMNPVDRTKFVTNSQIRGFAKKISWWQMQRYINQGFKLNGIFFVWDILLFLIYYKIIYDLEFNQIHRWNVRRYKLNAI
jgi:radical SAM superfamily enzyme YgiQ (UPF0313 family)